MTNETQHDARMISSAYDYCRQVTRHHAKSFYFAAKFLPRHKQLPIYALYALCRHVDDEVDEAEVRSEIEAVRAVERWKEKLNSVYDRSANYELRITNYETTEAGTAGEIQNSKVKNQNLILTAWRDLLKTYKIPQHLPLELMKGVLMDTHINRYETFDELYVYCYRVASTVGLMSSEIFGYEKPETLEFAEALGIAMQITNILRDVKEDAQMNRIYLPQEDLRKFKVTETQIFEGQSDENFVNLMKFEIDRARHYYREAEQGIPLLEKDTRFTVLLASRIYGRILDEIERQNYDVFSRRAHTSRRQKFFSIPLIWRQSKKL